MIPRAPCTGGAVFFRDHPSMTPQDFIRKWKTHALTERAAAQEHFLDLCRLFDHPTPAEDDPKGDHFTFEKGAAIAGGGWADAQSARSRRHRSRGRAGIPRPHPAQNRRGRREAKDSHVDQSLQGAPELAGQRPRRTRPRGGFRLWLAGGYLDRGRAGEIAGAQSGAGCEAITRYAHIVL